MMTKYPRPEVALTTTTVDPLFDAYEALLTRREQLHQEQSNLDRQIQEARTELKSALSSASSNQHQTAFEIRPATKVQLPNVKKANALVHVNPTNALKSPPSMESLDGRTRKILMPILRTFTPARGEFTIRDVAKTLNLGKSTAGFRLRRAISLGFYKQVRTGFYERVTAPHGTVDNTRTT